MQLTITPYAPADLPEAVGIWNEVVLAGEAFPQEAPLTEADGHLFFAGQSFTGIARSVQTGQAVGLYILHPNNVGRCGHICNASYAVRADLRGRGIGEALVRHCMTQGRALGFTILQLKAVVSSNTAALRLYQKLGFVRLGVIPGGFRRADGRFADIIPHYRPL